MLLSSSIFEAHTRTILMTYDQIRERWRVGIDQQKLFLFKNMVRNFWAIQLWFDMLPQICVLARSV